jgi:hypothetical protein
MFIWHMKDSTKKEIEHEAYMRQDENGNMGLNRMGRWWNDAKARQLKGYHVVHTCVPFEESEILQKSSHVLQSAILSIVLQEISLSYNLTRWGGAVWIFENDEYGRWCGWSMLEVQLKMFEVDWGRLRLLRRVQRLSYDSGIDRNVYLDLLNISHSCSKKINEDWAWSKSSRIIVGSISLFAVDWMFITWLKLIK